MPNVVFQGRCTAFHRMTCIILITSSPIARSGQRTLCPAEGGLRRDLAARPTVRMVALLNGCRTAPAGRTRSCARQIPNAGYRMWMPDVDAGVYGPVEPKSARSLDQELGQRSCLGCGRGEHGSGVLVSFLRKPKPKAAERTKTGLCSRNFSPSPRRRLPACGGACRVPNSAGDFGEAHFENAGAFCGSGPSSGAIVG